MKKPRKPVIIYDSGIGGLTVLYQFLLKKPKCDVVYFADYQGAPYGIKPLTSLRKNLLKNLKILNERFDPQGIVLACNTATAVGVGLTRRNFKDKFIIGTEPAVKPAIVDGQKDILLLATPNTIKYNKLVNDFLTNDKIKLRCEALANLSMSIEKNVDNLGVIKDELRDILARYIGEIDALVLGCTHYIFLRPIIQEMISSDIKIYDGNYGVVRQILRKIEPTRDSKLFVVTNDLSKKNQLYNAWELLKKEGAKICVE